MADEHFDPAHNAIVLHEGSAAVAELRSEIDQCLEFVDWISQYKNIVKGVPSAEQYMSTYTSMRGAVDQMQSLQGLTQSLATKFTTALAQLAGSGVGSTQQQRAVSVMVRVLDMCAVLNYMKMLNPALLNDFSMFKRSFQQVRGELPSDEADDVAQLSNNLHFFLANPNAIVDTVRDRVHDVQGFEESMNAFLQAATDAALVRDEGVSGPERNAILRALVYGVYVVDGNPCNAFALSAVKAARRVVKLHPEVAIHGSLSMTSVVVLKGCKSWDPSMESEWSGADDFFSSCALL